jgi:hypothetical protein
LLKMELAALPRDGREDSGASGAEALMGIANDELDAVESTGLEGGQEGAPVNLGLAQSDTETKDGTFAIRTDSDGAEHGTIQELAALADLFVSGIQDEVGAGTQGTFAPGLEFGIKSGCAVADLGGADRMAAEFFNYFGDFASGYALDVHFGQSKQESLFAAGTFFQGTGIKLDAIAHLRDIKFDGAETGGEGFGFEAIGASESAFAALVRACLENGRAFLEHGLVNEEAEALGKAGGTFGGEELQNVVQEIRVDLVGHVCVGVGCVW